MNLDDIIGDTTKTSENLSAEEKTFLTDNKDNLTDEDAKRFGIDVTPVVPDPATRGGAPADDKPKVDADGKPIVEGDDDTPPEDKVRINKMVSAQVDPIRQQLQTQNDTIEVDGFLRSNAEKFPVRGGIYSYRDAMLKYMKVYTNVPAAGVFAIVAQDELMRMGAVKEREAAAKAGGTRVDASSARPAGDKGKKDWGAVSQEDFKAEKARVLGRPVA